MQQSNEFMADLWGMFCHQLPNTKYPIDCVWTIPQQTEACCGSPVIPQWKKFKEFVSDHRIYEALKKFFMNGRKQGNSSETVENLPFFLFCLFSFGTTHGKKRVEREFWKVFNSALPLLPWKYRAKLLLILKGNEANAEYFLIVAEEGFVSSEMLMFHSIEFLIIHF